jgi:hypothetical protein
MHFDGLCRRIGSVDPGPLAKAIAELTDDDWDEWDHRQQTFGPHRHTQTIPLLYDNDMRHTDPTPWPRLAKLQAALDPVLDTIRKEHAPAGEGDDNAYFIRIILTRLSPGTTINRHRDEGESLMRSHRYHVAIATNPLVDFFVGGTPNHFAAGEIWEINNRAYHAVRNVSNQGRVHLILDYVVPGERVDDPEGVVFA